MLRAQLSAGGGGSRHPCSEVKKGTPPGGDSPIFDP